MKRLLNLIAIALMMLWCACPVWSQDDKAYEKLLKTAFKYRNDIRKDVLKRIKAWQLTPILHGDYIENRNGRSLSLEGEELFTNLDYVRLQPFWYNYMLITSPTGKKGIVKAESKSVGTLVIPMNYDVIEDHGEEGYFLCTYTDGGVRKVRIFGLWGDALLDLNDPTDIRCDYFAAYNQYLVSVPAKGLPGKRVFAISYPDGQMVSKPFTAEDVQLGGSTILVTDSGKTKAYSDSQYGKVEHKHAGLTSMKSRDDIAYTNLFSNKWMDQAIDYFHNKNNYAKAIECFNFYERFDAMNTNFHDTYAGRLYVRIRMLCYNNAGHFASLQRYVWGEEEFKPYNFGMYFDFDSNSFYDNTDRIVTDKTDQADLVKLFNDCNNFYHDTYANIERQRQEEAEQAAAVANVIAGTLNTIAQGVSSGNRGGSSRSSSARRSTSGGSRASSSSGSSSSSGESQSAVTRKTCPRCSGKGTIVVEQSLTGGGLKVEKVTCSECGATYDKRSTGHRHDRCPSCRGTGYYELR
mgnify:CR=1 FL=1